MGRRCAWPSWRPCISSSHFWTMLQSAASGGGRTFCPATSGRLAGTASSVLGLPPRINSIFSLPPLAASIAWSRSRTSVSGFSPTRAECHAA